MTSLRLMDVSLVRSSLFLDHVCPESHPENPDRIAGLLAAIESDPTFSQLPVIEPSTVSDDVLRMIHEEKLIQKIHGLKGQAGWIDGDTYYARPSVDVALKAAGATVDLALRIWRGEYRRGFSIVRPPGHHATREQAMGFCLFNNVALAVAAVLNEKPDARVAVVDFDLHHGNGTQWSFYGDPRVLFVSSHRYPYYPGTGDLGEIGEGRGKGTTINFPVNHAFGDELFLPVYTTLVAPMLRHFKPDMVFVSAGFDAHEQDPMQGLRFSTASYGVLSEMLISVAEDFGGKILFVLEGGYNPQIVQDAVMTVLERLTGAPRRKFQAPQAKDVSGKAGAHYDRFKQFHSAFFPRAF